MKKVIYNIYIQTRIALNKIYNLFHIGYVLNRSDVRMFVCTYEPLEMQHQHLRELLHREPLEALAPHAALGARLRKGPTSLGATNITNVKLCTQQGRQREPRVETLHFPLSAKF